MTIIAERLAEITTLAKGSHKDHAAMCALEAVAYIAGEPWSDAPQCACPVITAFVVSLNDALSQEDRDRLILPLVPRIVGTRGSDALANRRSLMAADWLVRTHTPAWLRLAGLTAHADALASLPQITDMAQVPSIRGPIEAARRDASAAGAAAWAAAWDAAGAAAGAAAWDAARAAARAAAGDAAWDAARAAARAAAGDAAGAAAGAAAWAAAGAAAGDAAWDAARAAAGDALKPTQIALQESAIALLNRMIDAKD